MPQVRRVWLSKLEAWARYGGSAECGHAPRSARRGGRGPLFSTRSVSCRVQHSVSRRFPQPSRRYASSPEGAWLAGTPCKALRSLADKPRTASKTEREISAWSWASTVNRRSYESGAGGDRPGPYAGAVARGASRGVWAVAHERRASLPLLALLKLVNYARSCGRARFVGSALSSGHSTRIPAQDNDLRRRVTATRKGSSTSVNV